MQRFKMGANKLKKEITFTLIVKIIVLITIWYLFFSHPVADSLSPENIRHQIFGLEDSTHQSPHLTTSDNISYPTSEGERTWSPRV